MKKHSAEDYLDKLLDSVNGEESTLDELRRLKEAINIEEAIDALYAGEENRDVIHDDFLDYFYGEAESSILNEESTKKTKKEMYSRRVSKSEAEFLMEFEAELAGDDYDDLVKNFGHDTDEMGGEDLSYQGGDDELDAVAVSPKQVEENPVVEQMVQESPFMEMPVAQLADEMPAVEEASPFAEIFSEMEQPVEKAQFTEEPAAAMPVGGTTDSFDLGGVDLGALLNEANGVEPQMDLQASETTEESAGTESVEDMFSNLFGDEATGDIGDLFAAGDSSSEGIDLGNLGEEDLMSLLSGEGGLSDLGDMLSQSNSSEMPMDGLDAFAAFAENEMAVQSGGAANEDNKKSKKAAKGKGGLLDKIKELLFSDDDDEDELELKKSSSPTVNQLSGENADILAELEAEDNAPKGKGGFFGKLKKDKSKDKDKKEEKGKKKKPEKEKKPKKPKVPKEKKPKKPKEVDKTPPLPRGPVILIWVMVISLFALVFLGTNLIGYSAQISEAKSYYNTGNYAEAYQELLGLTVKEKDMALYNQVATLATVDSEINAYKVFLQNEDHDKAFDSLICAAGRCELNEDSADVYECLGQMEILKKEVTSELRNYDMTYEEALEMYHIKDREEYTIALYTKLKELGLY